MSQRAILRVCASCEWIFRGIRDCPACGFVSYGARYVYGDAAYRYEHTQKPWVDKKVEKATWAIWDEKERIKGMEP